jgi:hypothetical protein
VERKASWESLGFFLLSINENSETAKVKRFLFGIHGFSHIRIAFLRKVGKVATY